jgi:LysM repeat protein
MKEKINKILDGLITGVKHLLTILANLSSTTLKVLLFPIILILIVFLLILLGIKKSFNIISDILSLFLKGLIPVLIDETNFYLKILKNASEKWANTTSDLLQKIWAIVRYLADKLQNDSTIFKDYAHNSGNNTFLELGLFFFYLLQIVFLGIITVAIVSFAWILPLLAVLSFFTSDFTVLNQPILFRIGLLFTPLFLLAHRGIRFAFKTAEEKTNNPFWQPENAQKYTLKNWQYAVLGVLFLAILVYFNWYLVRNLFTSNEVNESYPISKKENLHTKTEVVVEKKEEEPIKVEENKDTQIAEVPTIKPKIIEKKETYHYVKRGETLSGLSKIYGVSTTKIIKDNALKKQKVGRRKYDYRLEIGQRVKIVQ